MSAFVWQSVPPDGHQPGYWIVVDTKPLLPGRIFYAGPIVGLLRVVLGPRGGARPIRWVEPIHRWLCSCDWHDSYRCCLLPDDWLKRLEET